MMSESPTRSRVFIWCLFCAILFELFGFSRGDAANLAEPSSRIPGLSPSAFSHGVRGKMRPAGAPATSPVKLSTCTFDSNRNVTIGSSGCGPDVYVDQSFTGSAGLGVITIAPDGQLVFLDNQSTQIDTRGIIVKGLLEAGDAQSPIGAGNVVTLNFTDPLVAVGATKGISVHAGGTLLLYGQTGVVAPATTLPGANPQAPSWAYLAAPAGPPAAYGQGLGVASPVAANGATTLVVTDKVDWQPGQWIVVAGTDFSPDGAEFVLISTVTCSGTGGGACTITLNPSTPLVNYHFGGLAPDTGPAAFQDTFAKNYGVDERAEVGLVSRNVKLTATITGLDHANGGEIIIMNGFAQVAIQGVEIEKFGKDQLGSYPIHFHMAGTVTPGTVLINSNTIHHSYNKCVTLHSTNGITLSNNVCARAVGHLYYLETGTEQGNTFAYDLGIGAMSNAFSIPATNTAALGAFWAGDYLTNASGAAAGLSNGYNGFNVAFTDNAPATVLGTSTTASGFWITNLGQNTFIGNSISGCQDLGTGFWILPPASAANLPLPPGNFAQNRAHGCYTGFDTASDYGVSGALLYTPQGNCLSGSGGSGTNCDVVTELDQLTATRNRNQGIWVRASWYDVEQARLATNRDGVSLVSSGGTEGSPPGEWSLLRDAIIVGISTNNPNRFGPCPYAGQNGFGGNAGCYAPVVVSNNVSSNGYPMPDWNLFGVMFYDGPARLEGVHFVNFNQDISNYLTASDLAYFNFYPFTNFMPCHGSSPPTFQYEGDAAMGWFQSNVNSYPPTQYAEGLTYHNVDLRHEIYTQSVEENACVGNLADFADGDKFTVILDHDQSLTGLHVVTSGSSPTSVRGVHPISLNNLPFLAGPGTADECLSMGQQDAALEGRPTSLISPYNYATLEFSALTGCNGNGSCQNNSVLIFTKDQVDYGGQIQFTDVAINTASKTTFPVKCGGSAIAGSSGVPGHACVALTGRNSEGIYEPKLMNGLGYTVGASAGMPSFVSLMFGDASVPGGISADNPFHARVGICYKNQGASAPAASAFTVYKGSKSFSGPNGNLGTLAPDYYNQLACNGLDNDLCVDTPNCLSTLCPSALFYYGGSSSQTQAALPQVATIADLNNPSKCPNGECWFYDRASGLLFLNVVQEVQNAGGPYSSPLGTCAGSPSGPCAKEDFYSYPATGAELYTVLADSSYTPTGASACMPYGGVSPVGPVLPDYTQPYPSGLNQLAYSGGTVIATVLQAANPSFPHQVLTNAPANLCPTYAPSSPDWSPAPSSAVPAVAQLSVGTGGTAIIPGATGINGASLYLFLPNLSYTVQGSEPGGSSTCSQSFTFNYAGITNSPTNNGGNCCPLTYNPPSPSGVPTIQVGAPPWPSCPTTG